MRSFSRRIKIILTSRSIFIGQPPSIYQISFLSFYIVDIQLSTIALYNKKENKSNPLPGVATMQNKALVIIDIQNDITKNYKGIIDNINQAIDWAVNQSIHVVYIRHENLSSGTRTFKPNTTGAELAPDLKMGSKNVFTKFKGNALTSEEFADFIHKNEICDFIIAGADAVACVKSTCYNLRKANYGVNVLADCVTSYDKRKIDEMLSYYESQGCKIIGLNDLVPELIVAVQEHA
jgi:nicotinamidase-related amidase